MATRMRRKRCAVCNDFIEENDETLSFKNRIIHKACFKRVATMTNQVQVEQKKEASKQKKETAKNKVPQSHIAIAVSEEEYKEKKEVLRYLESISGEKPTAKVYKNLEDYINKYRFTYLGILRGLQYYFEVLGNSPKGDCVGIVPYIYDEAQAYMDKLEEAMHINDSLTSKEIQEMYKKQKVYIRKQEKPMQINIAEIY